MVGMQSSCCGLALAVALVSGSAAAQGAQQPAQPDAAAPDTAAPVTQPADQTAAQPTDQTAAPAGQTAAQSEGLGEITVTARRVAENLQDVPVAVTAFSGEELRKQNALRVVDAALLAPSFVIQPNTTGAAVALSIRGQVQPDYPATLDPSVGTYVDDFYWARPYGLNVDLLDIQSVQVLKGPQGTLFGRNTTGGALLLQTNDPNFAGVSGFATATYGRFDERGATGVLNLPLVDEKLAVRVAGSFLKRDGFVRNSFDGLRYGNRNSWTARGKLLFNPTETLSLVFSGEFYRQKERPQPVRLGYIGPLLGPANGLAVLSYGIERGIFDPAAAKADADALIADIRDGDTYATNAGDRTFTKTQTYTGTATLETFFGAVKFIGGYRKVEGRDGGDFDGTPATIVQSSRVTGDRYQRDLEQFSGELQITGKAANDTVDFAAGALYFHEEGLDGNQSTSLLAINPNTPSVFRGIIDNDSFGVYGQATWRPVERLGITGGLRYSVDDKGVTLFNRTFVAAINGFFCSIEGAVPPECAASRRDDFESLSYTAGLDYELAEDVLLFAKTSKGFRSGGQNLRASGANGVGFVGFRPEIAYSHEGGLKSEFLDRRIRLNIAGYYTTVDDVQRTFLVGTAAGINSVTENAAKVRIYGGEAELSALVTTGLRLSASGAITRPKYVRYLARGQDRSNERFTLVPRYSWTVSGDYSQTFGAVGLNAHVDYAYTGRIALGPDPFDPANPAGAEIIRLTTQPAAGILNARVALSFNDDAFELAAFGRNITDKRFINFGVNLGPPLDYTVYQRREPATYGVTATVRFGPR